MMDENEMTSLLELALSQKEMFDTYVKAGFSESQALRLIAYHMAAIGQQNNEEEGS